MTELSKETVKRIEEEAGKIASIIYTQYIDHQYKKIKDAVIELATAEATHSMIVKAEMDKTIEKQEETINTYYDLNNSLGDKIKQLTAERDAYKEVLLALRNRYEKSEWIITEIDQVLNQFNNTENKPHE